jgi:hypothetical protein
VKRVCTFGWDHNVAAAVPYLKAAASLIGEAGYITNKEIPELAGMEYIPWTLRSFVRDLQSFDLAVLCHGDTEIDKMRCSNRFLAAAFAGVFPLIKHSQEYTEVAERLSAMDLCMRSPEDVPAMIRDLAPRKTELLTALRPKIWELYNPGVQGLALYEVFMEVLNA